MRRQAFFTVVVLVFGLVISGVVVYAQFEEGVFDITFKFMLNEKPMPPGKYLVEQPAPDVLTLRAETTGAQSVELMIITRLAQPETGIAEPRLVFDNVGGQSYLSEVWLPNTDGFVVRSTKGAHEHQSVKGQRRKK